MRAILISTFVFISTLSSISQEFKNVDLDDFNKIRKGKNVIVIDVRTREEFEVGHVEDAINIDINNSNFKTIIDSISKQKQILLYCRSGLRSSKAAKIFIKKGLTKVYNLEGGIISWDKLLRSI